MGGFSIGFGYISDATGQGRFYTSFSGNIGFGLGAGLDLGQTMHQAKMLNITQLWEMFYSSS